MRQRLKLDQCGVVLVDVQGKLATLMHESDTRIKQIAKLLQAANALSLPVLWLEQCADRLGSTSPSLLPHLAENAPIHKHTFSACEEPDFLSALKQSGRSQWLVCGMEAHICVYQTSLDMKDQGLEVSVVTDCIASREPDNRALAIRNLELAGVNLTGFEMCLFELLDDADHPLFKSVLPLLK